MDLTAILKRGACLRLLLLFLACGLCGCSGLINSRPPGPWHEAYQPIDDPDSMAFLTAALAEATVEFGEPEIPVNRILLRRSRKTEEAKRYRIGEDFSLTECIDPTNGVFVVYISVDTDHPNYHALLAHESVHLLNPFITDWYMEGLATVFSEQYCDVHEKEWGDWKRHFIKSRRDPYALSYRMMLELQEAFPEAYPHIVRYTMPGDVGSDWLRIDIDRWIGSLPPARRSEARDIIKPYTSELRRHTNKVYGFNVPEHH
jgi:hypothetical protein